MDNEIKKLSKALLTNMQNDYFNNVKRLNIRPNIKRQVNLTMSDSCENNIAILLSDILKSKSYKYIIDAYMSCKVDGKSKNYRPDIAIIDKNKIIAFIEVKAQMGYCGVLDPQNYHYILNVFKENKKQVKTKYKFSEGTNSFWDSFDNIDYKSNSISLSVSPKINYYIISVLSRNHHNNVEDTIKKFEESKSIYKDVHFYALYNENVWYNSSPEENAIQIYENVDENFKNKYRDLHGFQKLVQDIKEKL